MFIDGPCTEFSALICDFAQACKHVQVIGSFSMLEYIPETMWNAISTEDLDFQFFFTSEAEVENVAEIMKGNGYYPKENRVGKWICFVNPTLEADIVVTAIGQYAINPYCLPEPFANVAHCDSRVSRVIASKVGIPDSVKTYTSGWLSGVLGKSLKVYRYLCLDDWDTNTNRIKHGQKVCHDMYMILNAVDIREGSTLPPSFVDNLQQHIALVEEPLLRATNAIEALLGNPLAIGHRFASEWEKPPCSNADDISQKVALIVSEIRRKVDEFK